MAEIAATWRDVWRRLARNPLLLLLIVLGIAALTEASARLIDFVYPQIFPNFGYVVGALLFPGLLFVATLLLSILAALGALLVELRAGGFFLDHGTVFIGRFLGRVTLAWLVVLIAPNLLALPIGFLGAIVTLDRTSLVMESFDGVMAVIYVVLEAYLAALLLLRRLPAIASGSPSIVSPQGERSLQRVLFIGCLILFGAFDLLQFAYLQIGAPFAALIGYRVYVADILIRSALATLLAFAAYERAGTRDPAVATVFD